MTIPLVLPSQVFPPGYVILRVAFLNLDYLLLFQRTFPLREKTNSHFAQCLFHPCAAERTRTFTPLLGPAPQAGVSTIPPLPHSGFVWDSTVHFPEYKTIKLFLEYHKGATQMIFTPQQVPPFGLAISVLGVINFYS